MSCVVHDEDDDDDHGARAIIDVDDDDVRELCVVWPKQASIFLN